MSTSKIAIFITSIKLRLSDLFFLIGFIIIAVFLIFGQLFMQYPNPDIVDLKLPVIIVLFIVLLLSWSIYIYLEFKRGNTVNKYISTFFIFLEILGIIGVVIQPHLFEMDLVAIDGQIVHMSMEISTTHYIFFAFDIFSIILLIYIGLFIFPKRFNSIGILHFIGYAVLILCLVLIIYSYIVEGQDYLPFLKSLKEKDYHSVKYYSMESFIINPNAYGMMMMVGIMFCLFFHSIKPKWWYFLIIVFLYINMFFSFCRTCLLLSAILTLIYIYSYLILTYQKNKKKNKLLLILLSSLLIAFILIMVTIFAIKGELSNIVSIIIQPSDNLGTINTRERVWINTYQLISSSPIVSMFVGNGFGIINEKLLRINYASGLQNQYLFPTHNSYLNLFAEGGFLFLFAYLILLGYIVYIFIRCFKKRALTTLALSFGIIVFTFYSLIETIHYLVYPFMALLLIYNNIINKTN